MVRKKGQDNGIGADELPNLSRFHARVDKILTDYDAAQDYVENPVGVEELVIFGSFGGEMGVAGKSDLDLALLYWLGQKTADSQSYIEHAVGEVKRHEGELVSILDGEVSEVDVYAWDYLEFTNSVCRELAQSEPVETYYSLSSGQYESIYR